MGEDRFGKRYGNDFKQAMRYYTVDEQNAGENITLKHSPGHFRTKP